MSFIMQPLTREFTPAQFARHGGATLLVCVLITIVLTIAGLGTWDVNLVYSVSIGLLSWLTIESGRYFWSTTDSYPWPKGWRGVAVVVLGIVGGLGVGNWIGQRYQRHYYPDSLRSDLPMFALPLIITIVASAVMTLVFYLIGKSRHLQLQAEQAQRQAAQAQLALLQSQLEPHMLFNTLANLRVLIDVDPPRAQSMLDHLIDYLRATLGDSRKQEHSLRDEFARLEDYLTLMQIRMGKRLRFSLNLTTDMADIKVPSLLLQPLVENSIRHGFEPQIEGGEIRVSAKRIQWNNHTCVELTVRDTGCGIAQQPTQSGQHFGTTQVRE